ncbi:replication protein A 70 kDa DNA-binding subunit B-like [Nicotiana sylvestris]|uniref:replication protein A 70 kDa DNA-binding subunit B-like n=1 Tax=Nicotiana sylvestris TaxID=4096 RepID=UPI00388C4DDE
MKNTTKFTLWKDFIDLYGNKLLKQLNEYPVILARKIGRSSSGSSNKFSGLSNKFSTTIYFNPPYPQAVELKSWAKTIEPMLNAYKLKSTSSTGFVMVVPFEDKIIAIFNIQAQPQGHVFYVEAELSLPNENQRFCVLACSDCKQLFTRSFSRRTIYCTNCQRSTHLIPRCQFEVTVRDSSGFGTAIISDKPAEKMLCLSSEEIYDTYHVKKQLSEKIFKIQMKKLFTKYHDTLQKLSILSYMNKDNEIHQEFPPTMMDVAKGSKRKIERLGLEGREAQETTNKGNASYYKRGLEIKTPPLIKYL